MKAAVLKGGFLSMLVIKPFHTLLLPLALLLATGCSQQEPTQTDATGSAQDSAKIAELRTQLATLQTEAQRVKDAQAIKRLQRSFGYYMEEALWDDVASLFAENATLEFGHDGVYQGRERIREYLYAMGKGKQGLSEGQLNEYLQLMPVITLADDGMSAKARWRAIMLLGTMGGDGLWGEGPYENEYVKENGVWKFSKLQWFQTILVAYKGAWGHNEDYNKGIWVSDTLPPDAPPTHAYGTWPTTSLPPFSFPNPVGRYLPEAQEPPVSSDAAVGAQQ
jgi:hypothetical protein